MRTHGSRRDRVRAATVQEITETARGILAEQGPEAVTLRAIAREMGMTAPALYRYFASHEELLRHLVGQTFDALADTIDAALARDADITMKGKFMVACDEFRLWSLAHKREYALIFGSPLPGFDIATTEHTDAWEPGARRFGRIFIDLFIELWNDKPFPAPADDQIDPGLHDQIFRYRQWLGAEELPVGVIVIFVSCWIRLQGFVSLEVFGHLSFALTDPSPMFHLMLKELAARLGLPMNHDPTAIF